MSETSTKFAVGQLVHHRLFDYRGVIVDVDAVFSESDDWYQHVALSRPPKDEPWYRVLVHDAIHETYVAERNIEPDESVEPIRHPRISAYFSDFHGGVYRPRVRAN